MSWRDWTGTACGRVSISVVASMLGIALTLGFGTSARAASAEVHNPCFNRVSLFYQSYNPHLTRATTYTSGANYCGRLQVKVEANLFGSPVPNQTNCQYGSSFSTIYWTEAYGNPVYAFGQIGPSTCNYGGPLVFY